VVGGLVVRFGECSDVLGGRWSLGMSPLLRACPTLGDGDDERRTTNDDTKPRVSQMTPPRIHPMPAAQMAPRDRHGVTPCCSAVYFFVEPAGDARRSSSP
jgi:hypothetical protein